MPSSKTPRHPPWDPTKRLQLVCDPEEKRLWEIASMTEGRTMSSFARYYLNLAAREAIRNSRQHPFAEKVTEKKEKARRGNT